MATRGRVICPPPFFSCPHAEHQFDIRTPVWIMSISCIPCDGVNLRPSCVVSYSTVEKAENFSRIPCWTKTTRERPNRADKNGATIIPLLVPPFVPPLVPLTAHHATRHDIIEPPAATPTHHASRHAPRHAHRHATQHRLVPINHTPPRHHAPTTRRQTRRHTTRPTRRTRTEQR